MKISKESRQTARQLLRLCLVDGKLDRARVNSCVETLIEERPRGYIGTLEAFSNLIRLELARHHAIIESATSLDQATAAKIEASLQARHGADLTTEFKVNPDLIAGLRIQIGSDVWDGSVRSRLESLQSSFTA